MQKLTIPNREDFLNLLPKYSICAELGVFKGEFSEKIIALTKPKKFYAVDGWMKMFGEKFPYKNKRYLDNGELTPNKAYQKTIETLKNSIEAGICEVIVEEDFSWLKSLSDKTFDWIYIDSSHRYAHTFKELNECKRIIKEKGIICGHDWNLHPRAKHPGVVQAINEFLSKNLEFTFDYSDNHTQWSISRNGKYNEKA